MADLILGLDIGIASVGWGIIDADNGEIVDAGARLFNSAAASQNKERREARGARRITRRKKHRRERIAKLLIEAGIEEPIIRDDYNPYALRVKGLQERLSPEELYVALFHLAKRRGISYLDDIDESEVKGNLKINADLLKEQHPCEIQLERFLTYGKVRGLIEISSEDGEEKSQNLVNIFTTSAYEMEAQTIITKQAEFYPTLNTEFMQKYTSILTGKRKYYDGPGSEKSRTNYGRFKTDGTTLKNLFEILIGKCSVYPNELRAARASYTAQEFNVLNDLSNLRISSIEGERLNREQKEAIVLEVLNSKDFGSAKMMKLIAKVASCTESDIKGYRIDKKEKPEFHTFEVYRKIQKASLAVGIVDQQLSRETYDRLAYILTLNTEASEIRNQIKGDALEISEEMMEVCIALKKKGSFSTKWHALSLKAMNEMIPELYATSKNQMQIIHERGLHQDRKAHFADYKYIPVEEILEDIYNPIAKRSIRQSLNIVNQVLKTYGEFSSIVVELPRDYISSDEEKKELQKVHKKNEDEKKNAIMRAQKEYSFKESVFYNHKELVMKLRLWYQQQQRCIYSGKTISVVDLVQNPGLFEIDHVIPQSVSLDDGLNNKVLCYKDENQRKGQRSPFQYYKNKNGGWDFLQFKQFVLDLYKDGKGTISRTKKELLLMEDDINKWEVRRGFIARNLVDTRYASRVVLNSLEDFFEAHGRTTKVKVVRGKFTAQQRRKWNIHKDRSESYSHHALDALIIAATDRMKLWEKASFYNVTQAGYAIDMETGEILPKLEEKEFLELSSAPPVDNFKNQLQNIKAKIKYSHMVSKKPNRKISDATIYSTRNVDNKEMVIGKIKNIYDDTSYAQFKKRYDKNKEQFLMYQHDYRTFEILEKVMDTYPDVKNPFAAYKKEYGAIQKYSKKENGPTIHDVKYVDSTLGQHIDISDKNKVAMSKNKKVVLLSITPYRADVFFDEEKKQFDVVGVKYAAFNFGSRGDYNINQEVYRKLLEFQKIGTAHKFLFSLYRGDIIEFGDENAVQKYRFWSRNESGKNLIEVKPIDIPNYGKQAMGLKTITRKTTKLNKYTTDILGNMYLAKHEKDPREK
ncbi:type II CRISPR RNA-guided endonuclease Cas9 [Listeria rocourtiae]|uniref:type II CRISPR RNA-guided endonuclease Cas9 n=1 Tax=Listeria rocourtiae TaxID=647910 RepID=UPI0016292884|nr:type II CRISPR RNA-guided endonuclease Cas9 [Listeria rocourtiae]MBC1434047.1 type II CRISPR RNA-guided endonuclease Cas9 [Listeria rocourtiae]